MIYIDNPKGWEERSVKYIFKRRKQVNIADNPEVLSLSREAVKIRDISSNKGQLAESYADYHVVKELDLLLNPMDLISGANCSVSYVEGVISPAYINLYSDIANTIYYDYYFKHLYWSYVMFAYGKGVSFINRWTLNNETIMNFKMLYPPKDIQNKLVSYLENKMVVVNSEIEKNTKSIELMEEYRKSIINNLVINGMRNKNFQKSLNVFIDTIPNNWKEKKIRFLFKSDRGNIDKNIKENEIIVNLIPYTSIYKNREQYISNDDFLAISVTEQELKNGQVYKGDVLLTASSETADDIGHTSVVMENMPNFVFGSDILRLKLKEKIHIDYLKYIFENYTCLRNFESLCRGTTRFRFSMNDFKNVIIPIPPIEEQKEISSYLDNKCELIDKVINYRKQIIEKLEEYKKSLIYEVVTGKVDI